MEAQVIASLTKKRKKQRYNYPIKSNKNYPRGARTQSEIGADERGGNDKRKGESRTR
jgi:hypothetical protein